MHKIQASSDNYLFSEEVNEHSEYVIYIYIWHMINDIMGDVLLCVSYIYIYEAVD